MKTNFKIFVYLIASAFYFEPCRAACPPEPLTIGVDSSVVVMCGLLCPSGPYQGDVAQDVRIYCTTGCSRQFYRTTINDPYILSFMSFDRLIFLIHGSGDSMKSQNEGWMNRTSTDLACQYQATVCAVDWYPLSQYNYLTVMNRNTAIVAKYLHNFISYLMRYGARLENVQFVGHSMGCHISGLAARRFGRRRIRRIIALDPAGPLYNKAIRANRLTRSDALQTQCIYTNPGFFGISFNVCDANFWPNQRLGAVGMNPIQPKCRCEPLDRMIPCSHGASIHYFYSSLFFDLIGTKKNQLFRRVVEKEYFGMKYSGGVGQFSMITPNSFPYTVRSWGL